MAPADQQLLNGLDALIDSLSQLRDNCDDADKTGELQAEISKLLTRKQALLAKQFDSRTQTYQDATKALADATSAANGALDSVESVVNAIQKAVAVASALDGLVKSAAGL